MSAVDQLFQDLRKNNRRAFMPFLTAGDPDLATSLQLMEQFAKIGCHLCEVGIPYSDPIADGPTIQASFVRALDNGFKLDALLEQLPSVSQRINMPLVSMMSYSIIFRKGLNDFVASAKAAGFAGAIVPDCPLESAAELSTICREHDFSLIQLITPTTPLERAKRIAENTTGFIYFVSVTGITGERSDAPGEALEKISQLRNHTDLPICLGFGIGSAEHIKKIGPVVDGFIVGSAIVRRVADAKSPDDLGEISKFAESLLSAVNDL